MERLNDKDEGDEVTIVGNRAFIYNFPGSIASVGWQMVERFNKRHGTFWISGGADCQVDVSINVETTIDQHQAIHALTQIINTAREARNYLKDLNQ